MWSSAVGFKGAGASEGHGGHIWQVWEDVKEAGAPGRAGITWTGGGLGWGMETRGPWLLLWMAPSAWCPRGGWWHFARHWGP